MSLVQNLNQIAERLFTVYAFWCEMKLGGVMDSTRAELLKRRKRHRLSSAVIRRNTLWAAGTGLIPIPVLDSAAIVSVQIKMLAEISSVYEVPFQNNSGKSVIAAMMTTLSGTVLGKSLLSTGIFGNLMKVVPGVGAALSILTMPGFNAAFTYALGRVFQQHYAAGGTIKDFDPRAAEPYFKEKLKEGFNFTQQAKSA
jgi:uncharacterized protein (DUF697 family)